MSWAYVAKEATAGGIFIDEEAPLNEQPESIVLEIMAAWPQLVEGVKGGAK